MAPPKKTIDDLLNQRVAVMLSKAELDMIDDWSFANRIRSRGEAMRRLMAAGISKNLKGMKDARGSMALHDAFEEE